MCTQGSLKRKACDPPAAKLQKKQKEMDDKDEELKDVMKDFRVSEVHKRKAEKALEDTEMELPFPSFIFLPIPSFMLFPLYSFLPFFTFLPPN